MNCWLYAFDRESFPSLPLNILISPASKFNQSRKEFRFWVDRWRTHKCNENRQGKKAEREIGNKQKPHRKMIQWRWKKVKHFWKQFILRFANSFRSWRNQFNVFRRNVQIASERGAATVADLKLKTLGPSIEASMLRPLGSELEVETRWKRKMWDDHLRN